MTRFGITEVYHPDVRDNRLARLFLHIAGNVDTGSSRLHFMRIAKSISFSRALDAGCGKGKYTFWLAQTYPQTHVVGLDIDPSNIALCQEVKKKIGLRNIDFFVADLCSFKGNGEYDFVYSNHVLEHLRENELVLSNLVASLAGGGYIYIQIPNAIQKRVFGRRCVAEFDRWAEEEHVGQNLTLDSLSHLLQNLGCQILVKKYTSGFWGKLSFELRQMCLNYFHSRVMFVGLYPLLKLFGYIDSIVDYTDGNGILVLGQRTTASPISSAPVYSSSKPEVAT